MVAILIRTIRHRLANLLRSGGIENSVDRIFHKIADAGRQPMAAADEHLAGRTDFEMLERQRANELLEIAVVFADEFDQPVGHHLAVKLQPERMPGCL